VETCAGTAVLTEVSETSLLLPCAGVVIHSTEHVTELPWAAGGDQILTLFTLTDPNTETANALVALHIVPAAPNKLWAVMAVAVLLVLMKR